MVACWWFECPGEAGKDGLCAPHHVKDLRLRRTYGIGLTDVEKILRAQEWKCPVGREPLGPNDPWVIDHDHKTLIVRGALCAHHNHRVVGRHRDGEMLVRAGNYLLNPPARSVLGEDPTVPKKKRRSRKAAPKK